MAFLLILMLQFYIGNPGSCFVPLSKFISSFQREFRIVYNDLSLFFYREWQTIHFTRYFILGFALHIFWYTFKSSFIDACTNTFTDIYIFHFLYSRIDIKNVPSQKEQKISLSILCVHNHMLHIVLYILYCLYIQGG